MSTSRYILPLMFLLATAGLTAQEIARPDNARRARPDLDESYERKRSNPPYILSSPISSETGIFLNSNMVQDAPATVPQNESSIAIDPTDPRVLIASAVDARGAWVYVSSDGGRSWKNQRLGVINGNWQSGNDPSVGFDFMGTGYVMFGAFPSTGYTGESGVYVCKTTDKGKTWSTPMIVIEHKGTMTPDSAFEDKYYIEIDNSSTSPYRGYLYTPWKRVTDRDRATQIVVTRSTDGGLTWSTPIGVSPRKAGTSTDTTFGQSFPLTSTGPDGTLYVVWNDGPIRSIGFAKSTDGGLTFSAPSYPVQGYATLGTARTVKRPSDTSTYHVLKGTFRAETYPTMMADNSNSTRRGWLYLAWAAGLNPDVFFIRSGDGGATWSEPRVIHSVTTNDQWWPWLSVDQTNGDIAVMYSDSRNDPENITIDAYVSYSSDGGDTWIDRRATDVVSDFRKNPYVDQIFAGDYSGNAFHLGRIYPSFLDTRADNDVYTAVMSIFQPYPVENLVVRGRFENLTEATLSWKNPDLVSVFGKPIDDYTLVVSRDGAVRGALPAGTTTFTENGLTLNTVYDYEVRVATTTDTSAPRNVTFRAGDARRPAPPVVSATRDFAPQVQIDLVIPSVRADSTTPLTNVRLYRLYRDGTIVSEGALNSLDTGRTITAQDVPVERGYYRYYATVLDGADPGNESAASDTVIAYGGSLDLYAESFDATQPRFLRTGTWGPTDEIALSAPNALTDAPRANYKGRQNTFLQVFPVSLQSAVDLKFAHIVLIDPTDTAFVEISYDRGETWALVARYDSTSYAGWGQGPDPDDWRLERLTLRSPSPGNDATGVVRFRLKTSDFRHGVGWFIDDIEFVQSTSAVGQERRETAWTRLRPNPFRDATILEYALPNASTVTLRIYDVVGRLAAEYDLGQQTAGNHAFTIDARGLAPGAYLYEVASNAGISRGRMLLSP